MHIETSRLVVRPWRAGDRAAFERMVADSDMMRFITQGRAWRPDEVDDFFERQARELETNGCCMGVMDAKHTGEPVGIAGIQSLDAPGEFEIGWWVWKDHWGQGYATEAGEGLVAHARDAMGLASVCAVIDPANAASIRVAEKLGMRYQREVLARETAARRGDLPVAIYSLGLGGAAAPHF